jgi:rhodanese-related sulfurtransferase
MNQNQETPELSVSEAVTQLEKGAFLLDVREPDEYTESHLAGATLIPLGDLAQRTAELPRDREIIAYCRSGGRSARAVDFLREQGFNAHTLQGGIIEWNKEGQPVER